MRKINRSLIAQPAFRKDKPQTFKDLKLQSKLQTQASNPKTKMGRIEWTVAQSQHLISCNSRTIRYLCKRGKTVATMPILEIQKRKLRLVMRRIHTVGAPFREVITGN